MLNSNDNNHEHEHGTVDICSSMDVLKRLKNGRRSNVQQCNTSKGTAGSFIYLLFGTQRTSIASEDPPSEIGCIDDIVDRIICQSYNGISR